MTQPEYRIAPPGKTWLCPACGKTEHDRYGVRGGWDEACMMQAVLVDEWRLVYDVEGRVERLKGDDEE